MSGGQEERRAKARRMTRWLASKIKIKIKNKWVPCDFHGRTQLAFDVCIIFLRWNPYLNSTILVEFMVCNLLCLPGSTVEPSLCRELCMSRAQVLKIKSHKYFLALAKFQVSVSGFWFGASWSLPTLELCECWRKESGGKVGVSTRTSL